MICIKCNERIPIISNIDFHSGTISLYCQCDNENEIYNIRDYLLKLKKLKEEKENIIIKNQVCFIHKDNDIELICVDCFKELCRECDLKIHQKENHQLLKLEEFSKMISNNLNYLKNINDLKYFESFNIEYIKDIINFIELSYCSFNSQKDKKKINYTALKNVCYIELILSESDVKKDYSNENLDKAQKVEKKVKKTKYQLGIKVNSMRKFLNIKNIELKSKNISPSFLNVLLIHNSYYCVLITVYSKLLIIKINFDDVTKEFDIKIEIEYILDSKLFSSFYKLTLLNEEIFSLLYNSGSFDLFFICKEKENQKIKLIRKKYINTENRTNIINQIFLAKEKDQVIVLMKDKINFYKYDESESISLVKQIDRNNITFMHFLNFHNSLLTLFNTQKIIIKDETEKNNYIINIKEKQINIILEIKSFNYLAITHFHSDIDIFDLNIMVMKTKLKGHKKIVNDIKELKPLENSNYNSKLISCSDDKTIRIWDLINFYCEYIICLDNYGFLFELNILPKNEIMALDNENVLHVIE